MFINLEPFRGTIYDCNFRPLAINLPLESLYAVPSEIENRGKTIKTIAPILNIKQDTLEKRFKPNKHFVWLARKLSNEVVEKIKGLNYKGLYFIKESKRVYPNMHLGSHLLGFAGLDNKGLEGIELYYDSYLHGNNGWGVLLRDGRQEQLGIWEKLVLPTNGYNLVLTVDEVVQFIVEQELDYIVEKFKPKGASVVVLDISTGQVLALANRPTYDLNKIPQSDNDVRRNRALTDLFEPGSVFKIVTVAAALEESLFKEDDKFFCENGSYRVASHILHDHHPYGWLTFREVVEHSSNIGVTKIAEKIGKDLLYQYIKRFGFGTRLGIDLPGEIDGIVKSPAQWSKVSIGAVPIGHEVGVTLIQLVCAVAGVANNGKVMKPYVVKEVQDEYGSTIKEFAPEVLSWAISPQTAERLKEILVGVVENGTGKKAQIENMRVAGKTGTAQKIEGGRYSHNKFISSFIGFAPADNPKIAVAISVDEPRPVYYGGTVCAPSFKNICSSVLRYLNAQAVSEK